MSIKRCGKCKEYKELEEFYNEKRRKDGRMHWCSLCVRKRRTNHFRTNGQSDRDRYTLYMNAAGKRGIEFLLSYEMFLQLINKPCAYGQNSPVIPSKVGIDRKDNKQGYIRSNCVPCCWRHNRIKSDIFTHAEMLSLVTRYDSANACEDAKPKGYRVFINELLEPIATPAEIVIN